MKKYLALLPLALMLNGCTTVMVTYNQSQDELRNTSEKFGGTEQVAIPMETILQNTYLTTKHCRDYPNYVYSPDKQYLTASMMYMGWTAPAYQVVIDIAAKKEGVEIKYWGQNDQMKDRARGWIENIKNPDICKVNK